MNLSHDQLKALETGQPVPVIIDETECVLVKKDVYDQIRSLVYDDSDWTEGEMRAASGYAAHSADNPDPVE